MNREKMVQIAEELNEVMGLEPPIDTELNDSSLREALLEAAELVEPGDEISDDADATLTALVDEEDEDKTLEDTPGEPDTKEEDKDEEQPATKSITRVESVVLAIKTAEEPLSKDDLAKEANRLYAQSGGTSNLKESKFSTGQVISALTAYGVIQVEDGTVSQT